MTQQDEGSFMVRLEQGLVLCLYHWMILGWPFFGVFCFLFLLLHRSLWPLGLLYFCWYCYDFNTPRRGSRHVQWIRNWSIWKTVAAYFPVEIVKTAELPPDRNYVIAAHPHGVFGISSALTFGSNATRFQQLFPHIECRVATLPMNFLFPFRRECLIAMGIISSDADSIGHVLNSTPGGRAVGIVPGGVAELSISRPGQHKLVLANRKGFVKLAIKFGADLVPVYHFGEQDILIPYQLPGLLDKFQKKMKSLKGAFIPLAYGRSFLSVVLPEKFAHQLPPSLCHGIVPFRRRIVTVVGAPIRVVKNEKPSQEEIDTIHKEYCDQLRALFDKHKCQLGGLPESVQLELV